MTLGTKTDCLFADTRPKTDGLFADIRPKQTVYSLTLDKKQTVYSLTIGSKETQSPHDMFPKFVKAPNRKTCYHCFRDSDGSPGERPEEKRL